MDPDITNKTITITIPGKAFTGKSERWIEIKQGATIRKAKYKIDGAVVDEQLSNRKTILTVTDDFSGYTKDIPATINVYLIATATKPVATATLKVIDMPFKLVFFKTDHLGTPRVITDQDGKVLSTHDYLAYGEELTDPEFTTNRMKFTGHERDPETGLDYMLARYYTAGSGRFLQVDPGYDYDKVDPMSFNLYGYVRGNPIMGTDPTGMRIVLRDRNGKLHFYNSKKDYFAKDKDGKYIYDKNVRRMVQALKSLANLNPKLKAMINSLIGSSHIHTLHIVGRSSGPGNNPSDGCLPLDWSAAETPGVGSGTENKVELNCNEDSEYGGFASPLSRLVHELKHAFDADKGILDRSKVGGKIEVAEIRAIYYENIVRARTYLNGQPNGKMRHIKGRLRFRYAGNPITNEMFRKFLRGDYDKKDF